MELKKLLVLFFVLSLGMAQSAQIFTQNSLKGLKNDEGKVVIDASYSAIEQLQYTPVKSVIIPMQSTKKVNPVKLDYYKLKKNNKWGVCDKTGKIIAKVQYDNIKVTDYGTIILVKGEEETLLTPVKNTAKKTAKTLEAVVGLPVTIVAGAMMPIEVISKVGNKQ